MITTGSGVEQDAGCVVTGVRMLGRVTGIKGKARSKREVRLVGGG